MPPIFKSNIIYYFICAVALFSGGIQQVQALDFDPKVNDPTLINSITSISLGQAQPTVVAFQLINSALSLLAGLCVGLLIYAGFLWIWARGGEEEIKKAKDIILGTVIGLAITLSALGITYFVFQNIAVITGATVS